MKTVAIDTSLPSGSVAALDGERMREVCFAPAQAHARRIAAALTEATAELGWGVADADLVGLLVTASLVAAPGLCGAEGWPDFRGPSGQGHSATAGLPSATAIA